MSISNPCPLMAFVIPCYNEEEILPYTIQKIQEVITSYIKENFIDKNSFILLVDDGSSDNTFAIIKQYSSSGIRVRGLKLAINVGHQNALLAGIHYVTGKTDCMISLDADLQDDISAFREMIQKYKEGSQIVYGVRKSRETDSLFKRKTAQLYNRILKEWGVKTIYNHADCRLLSDTILKEFSKYEEVNLYLRGIFPSMGFKSSSVYYDRQRRLAGKTKYPIRKMIKFAIEGVTSFTNKPLKIISWIGFIVFVISLLMSVWVLIVVIRGKSVPGWASITLPVYFMGGIQLLAIGVLGEYISKIYMETKRRPRYHIEEET